MRRNNWWLVDSPYKGPVMWKALSYHNITLETGNIRRNLLNENHPPLVRMHIECRRFFIETSQFLFWPWLRAKWATQIKIYAEHWDLLTRPRGWRPVPVFCTNLNLWAHLVLSHGPNKNWLIYKNGTSLMTQGAPLLTWFSFNPSMDKQLHSL